MGRGLPAHPRRHRPELLQPEDRQVGPEEPRMAAGLRPVQRADHQGPPAGAGPGEPEPVGAHQVRQVPGRQDPGLGTGHLGLEVRLGPQRRHADRRTSTTKVDTWQYPALRSRRQDLRLERSRLRLRHPGEVEAQGRGHAARRVPRRAASRSPTQLVASGAAPARDDIANVKPFADEPKLVQAGKDLATSLYVPTGDGSEQIAQAVANATELILQGKADGKQAYESFVKDATDLLGPNLVK